MQPRTLIRNNRITVFLSGDIDHHTARRYREYTDALIQEKKPSCLALDFSGVSFMDSSGIGLIMGRYRMMLLYGGKVRVVGVPAQLKKMMELSGIGGLDVFEGREISNENN